MCEDHEQTEQRLSLQTLVDHNSSTEHHERQSNTEVCDGEGQHEGVSERAHLVVLDDHDDGQQVADAYQRRDGKDERVEDGPHRLVRIRVLLIMLHICTVLHLYSDDELTPVLMLM